MSEAHRKFQQLLRVTGAGARTGLLQFLLSDPGIRDAVTEEAVREVFQEVWRGFVKPCRDGAALAAERLGIAHDPDFSDRSMVLWGRDYPGEHVLLKLREPFHGLLQWGSVGRDPFTRREAPLQALRLQGSELLPVGTSTLLPLVFRLREEFPSQRIAVTGQGTGSRFPVADIRSRRLTTVDAGHCIDGELLLFRYSKAAQPPAKWEPIVLSVLQSFDWNGKRIVDRQECEERVIDLDGLGVHEVAWDCTANRTSLEANGGVLRVALGFDAVVRNVCLALPEAADTWQLEWGDAPGPERTLTGNVEAEAAQSYNHAMHIKFRGHALKFTEYDASGNPVRQWRTVQRWRLR